MITFCHFDYCDDFDDDGFYESEVCDYFYDRHSFFNFCLDFDHVILFLHFLK